MLDHVRFTLIHGPNIPGSYAVLFFTASDFTFTTRYIHSWALFLLWLSCFIFTEAISNYPLLFLSNILNTFWTGGAHLPVSYLFAYSYCSWGSCNKNTGRGCHFLLRWTTFCQNSSLWPVHPGWPCTACLSFTELYKPLHHDKPVIHERVGRMRKLFCTEKEFWSMFPTYLGEFLILLWSRANSSP